MSEVIEYVMLFDVTVGEIEFSRGPHLIKRKRQLVKLF